MRVVDNAQKFGRAVPYWLSCTGGVICTLTQREETHSLRHNLEPEKLLHEYICIFFHSDMGFFNERE